MDASIINTAITAISSIVTCLIGIQAGKQKTSSPSMNGIQEQQLTNVFLPIEHIFQFGECKDIEHVIAEGFAIIEKNFILVPPALFLSFKEVKELPEPKTADLNEVKKINASYFNLTKKALGYPYDAGSICIEHTPFYERNDIFRKLLSIILCVISLILLTASGATTDNYIFALISAFVSILVSLTYIFYSYKK